MATQFFSVSVIWDILFFLLSPCITPQTPNYLRELQLHFMFYTIGVIHGGDQDGTGHSGQVCTQKR
jgi:hypothetical protein